MVRRRLENLLERTNNPILVLAVVAIVLYIIELFRIVPPGLLYPFLWANFLIDLIFLIDLVAKCMILGRSYVRSPWFLIDFLSTLPIISSAFELMGAIGPHFEAARAARGARVARIARIARVARLAKVGRVARLATAIRAKQGLNFLKIPDHESEQTPRFNRALFVGIPILLLGFIVASSYITNSTVQKLEEEINAEISFATTQEDLAEIMQKYDASAATSPLLENTILYADLNGRQEVPVSLEQAYARADRLTGIMLLVVLLTIGLSVFISNSLARDRSHRREQLILSQCFSPPIVDKFYSSPEVVDRFYRQWMSVFFIDIRGFTKAVEKDSKDVEGFALKLRKVMDVAREQIVISHEGIIDKFMGDAVMGWVGGHFSAHWKLLADIHQRLYIAELDSVDQDIRSISREIEKHGLSNNGEAAMADLNATLEVATKRRSELAELQEAALKKNPELTSQHEQLITEYRKRVAKSAVSCCLRIWQEVEKIDDPNGFNKLKIGVGSGQVLIGNFGATDQIAYTVLGPTVNRAARLEPASAQAGCHILVDQSTYDLLKNDDELCFRRLPLIQVKGIANSMVTYEPFFAKQVSEAFLSTWEKGVAAVERGENQTAIGFFTEADKLFPGDDAASQIWLAACKKAMEEGGSLGVTTMKK